MKPKKLHKPLYHYKSWRMYVCRFFLEFLYLLVLLLMLCVYVNYNLQTNLGMALVCMVNSTVIDEYNLHGNTSALFPKDLLDQCPTLEEEKEELGYKGTFVWSTFQQNCLISAIYYATLITIPFSGTLADKYNTKRIVIVAMTVYVMLTVLAPTMANFSYYAFLGTRFAMGLVDLILCFFALLLTIQGLLFPSVTSIIVRWFPPSERSTAAAVYTSGAQLCVFVNSLMAPPLCKIEILNGWPFIFYATGLISFICIILVGCFMANRPSECRWIGHEEQTYLVDKLQMEQVISTMSKKPKVPYCKILSSPVILSIAFADFSYNMNYVTFSQIIPSFLRDVMRTSLSENGLLTALPFLVMVASKIPIATLADFLKHRRILSVTTTCKLLQSASGISCAIIYLCLSLIVDCTTTTLVFILFITFGLAFAGQTSGAFSAVLYVAPPFVGTVASVTTFTGMVASVVSPAVFSILNVHNTRAEYANVFYFCAGINLVSAILFAVFGSAEIQPWAKVQKLEYTSDTKEGIDKY